MLDSTEQIKAPLDLANLQVELAWAIKSKNKEGEGGKKKKKKKKIMPLAIPNYSQMHAFGSASSWNF